MASKNRAAAHAVELMQKLRKEPYRFDFYQAIRRIECLHPDSPRFGRSRRAGEDPLRLSQEPSVAFAPSPLASFQTGKADQPARLAVNFFGLFGPNGPLPLHLTEHARNRLRNSDDPTFIRFVDMFHHRMLSLFFRAWADAQPTVSFDRPGSDRFATYMGSLFGIGMPSLRDRDAVPDRAKFYYAGRLACQARPAEGLRALLQDFFNIPVSIEEFVGQWVRVPRADRCRLGESLRTGVLGKTTLVGTHVFDCQQKFRILFGPMRLAEYRSLLPGNDSVDRLIALVRNYIGHELVWDARLILKKEEVPPLELGVNSRLGWTSWLINRSPDRNADNMILDAVGIEERNRQRKTAGNPPESNTVHATVPSGR